MTNLRGLLFLLVIGTSSLVASAATSLQVEVAWGGFYRSGYWAPIYVTASESSPRSVEIEVYAPHDQIHGMRIRQRVTIGPTPATFPLYVPMRGYVSDSLSVTLYDANTHRRLASATHDNDFGQPTVQQITPVDRLIAVSGSTSENRTLLSWFTTNAQVVATSLQPPRLPAVAHGYDSLNLLVLDRPDLTRLAREQQEAIVDWVRAGGELLCWMSEDALPASSPLLDVLPAVVGENISLGLSETAVRAAGLPARFTQQKGRKLIPISGAQQLSLFNGEATGYRRRLGLGTISILPLDPSSLLFDSTDKARDFLQKAVVLSLSVDNKQAYYNPYNADLSAQSRARASSTAMDLLGDVPGAGSFGFSYVALVMVLLILIVGPIDWIILKKLDRQPLTWVTTAGWIVLVTTLGIYLGYIFKSGDLHFRTLRLIDQVDGMTIATIDAAGIYSPSSRDYQLDVQREGWWEPMSADAYFYRSSARSDLDFHQDYLGTRPEALFINVWNLRFLESDLKATGAPVLSASLRAERREGKEFLVGTITNASAATISNLVIRTHDGYCPLSKINLPPSATTKVDHLISRAPALPKKKRDAGEPDEEGNIYVNAIDRAGTLPVSAAIFDLAADRSEKINSMLNLRNDLVCIYGDMVQDQPPAKLDPDPTIQKHWMLVRALVELERSNP